MQNIVLKGHAECLDPKDGDRRAAEYALAKQMAETLQRMYPGHQWATFADTRTGLGWIAIPRLMGDKYRLVVHLDQITSYSEMTNVLREGGGEILERYRIPRRGFVLSSFQDALARKLASRSTKVPE